MFQIVMAAVFKGQGNDAESAQAAANTQAEQSILGGTWQLKSMRQIGNLDSTGKLHCEYEIVTVIEAVDVDAAIDVAVSQLSTDWELAGEPTRV